MTAVLKIPTPTQAALEQLASQGFVQYHPVLADKLGSFKAALFLGHALYWARHVQTNFQSRDGWFFLSARQCTEATGLSAREQASARQLLVEHSLLAEMLSGRPAKLHYKVDLTHLARLLGMPVTEQTPTWQQLLPLLKGCINFYRPLAFITGNVASGLYLSYLLGQHRHFMTYPRQADGFTVSQSALRSALCLGPKTQRNARDRLKQIGLLIEHGNLLQINLQALSALLQGQAIKPLRPPRKSPAAVTEQAAPHLALVQAPQPQQPPEAAPHSARLFKPAAILQKKLFGLNPVGPVHQVQITGPAGSRAAAQAQIVAALRNPGPRAGRLFGHLARKRQPLAAPPTGTQCQTGAENAKLELPEVQVAENANLRAENAKLTGPKRKTKLPKTQNINTTSIKKTTTNTAPAVEPAAVDNSEAAGSAKAACRRSSSNLSLNSNCARSANASSAEVLGMAMPGVLKDCWHDAVRLVLSKTRPEHRQPLLDELEGQLSNPAKKINNPPGYLHSLRMAMECGMLNLAHADAVAAERKERERMDAAIKHHVQQQAQVKAATPALSRSEALARLKQQSSEMRANLSTRGGR